MPVNNLLKHSITYFISLGLFASLLLSPFVVISQNLGYLTVKGTVMLDDIGIPGAKVVLFKNGVNVDQVMTKGSGKFIFRELPLIIEDIKYIIKISKPGHVTIKHLVSTKVPADRKADFPTYNFEVELFKRVANLDKSLTAILQKPISKFAYTPAKDDFADDKAYFSIIQAKVEQLFEILQAEDADRYRLLAEYRINKMQEKERQNAKAEAKADELANKAMDKGDVENTMLFS